MRPGAAASTRWSAPIARPIMPGPQQRGPGRAVGVAWLAIDSSPAPSWPPFPGPQWHVRAVRSRSRVKVAGLAAGEEAYVTLAAVDEAVLKLTEFESPAPGEILFRQAPARRRIARPLWQADRRAGERGRVLRSGGDSFAKRSVAGLPDKSSQVVALVFRHRPARCRRRGAGPFRHPRFPGPAAADGRRLLGAQGRLRGGGDDGPRPGGDDRVVAALSRPWGCSARRGHDQ